MTVFAQGGGSELTGLAGWVAGVMEALGAPGVGMLVLLETLFPPVPSEIILPLGGYLASQDRMGFVAALVWATAGSLVGAFVLYWVGERLGDRRLDALLRRIPLMDADDLEGARRWFDRHGNEAVFLGRFAPGVRSVISLPAGAEQMPLGAFFLYTGIGSLLWNLALIGLGYVLGSSWQNVGRYSDLLNLALIAALVVAVGRFVWHRRDRMGTARHGRRRLR